MRLLPALILLAACSVPSTPPPDVDLAAPSPPADLATTTPRDLGVDNGGPGPAGDGGACFGAATPPTTLYLDYCMDAPSSFCFHDTPNSGFF